VLELTQQPTGHWYYQCARYRLTQVNDDVTTRETSGKHFLNTAQQLGLFCNHHY
jgi:hypothetical protein